MLQQIRNVMSHGGEVSSVSEPVPAGSRSARLARLTGGRGGRHGDLSLLAFLICAYVLLVVLRSPDFLSVASVFDLVRSGAAWTVVALGVLVVMVSGGIDVSFLANAMLSAYVATALSRWLGIDSLTFALVVTIGVGALVGAINGLIITLFSLPTLITTLAMQGVIQGVLMVFLGARPIMASRMPSSLRGFGTNSIFEVAHGRGVMGLSVFVIPLIVAIVATWFLLNRTAIGRATYALGSNQTAALRCGVNLLKVNLVIYAYAGALAGLMGLMMVSDIRMVDPVALVGNELIVLAAVVIGGAKLTGGTGSVAGVLLGMTLVTLLNNTLVTIGLSASWNRFFIGSALVLVASIAHYRLKLRNLRQLHFENT